MNLPIDANFDLMKLLNEEDWEMLYSEEFSPINKLKKTIAESKAKSPENLKKILLIFELCFQSRAQFHKENFKAYNFLVYLTEKIYKLENFDENIHQKELKNTKARLTEFRKKYLNNFFGLKEIISKTSDFELAINSLIYFDREKQNKNYEIIGADLLKKIDIDSYLCNSSAYQLHLFFDKQARHLALNNNMSIEKSILKSLDYLDLHVLFQKLEINLGLLNLALNRTNVNVVNCSEIKPISRKILSKHILLDIYYQLFTLLKNDILEKTQDPEKKVKQILKLIKKVEVKKLNSVVSYKTQLNLLNNYCKYKATNNDSFYFETQIKLIEILDKNNFIIQRETANPVTFKNTIVLFLKTNNNKKAFNFFTKYNKRLNRIDDLFTEKIKNYSQALIFIDQKNYESAGFLMTAASTSYSKETDKVDNKLILDLYIRQIQLIIAIEAYKRDQKITDFKLVLNMQDTYIKRNEKEHPEITNLANLVDFAKNCFKKNIKIIDSKPLTFLQRKWLTKILKITF